MSDEPLLRVAGLRKYFPITRGVVVQRAHGHVKAVDGISFDVRAGETLGLVGENGLWEVHDRAPPRPAPDADGGADHLSGSRLREALARGRRVAAARHPDDLPGPVLVAEPRHTVGTIVAAPFRIQHVEPAGGIKAAVQELLELVGLSPEHYNRYPQEFSGGQRQRISVARAVALRPKLIVADEPVSALDVSIQAQIINLLEDLQAELQLTYVFIAHDLSVVRHISDRVAVMYLGKIVEIGDRRRRLRDAPSSVHARAALGGAGSGAAPQRPARCRPDQAGGRRSQPGRPAARLQLPHALLEGAGDLPNGRAAAGEEVRDTPGRLPLPGELAGLGVRYLNTASGRYAETTQFGPFTISLIFRSTAAPHRQYACGRVRAVLLDEMVEHRADRGAGELVEVRPMRGRGEVPGLARRGSAACRARS